MAKVYGIHEIELHPAADPAAFEQLATVPGQDDVFTDYVVVE